LLKIGYDEAYRRCSPGQLLMLEVIRDAARRGLQRVEFLGFSAPWTRVWTEVERPMSTVRFFPLRPGSIVPAARHALGQLARKRSRESA
jgi:hypothetical protein